MSRILDILNSKPEGQKFLNIAVHDGKFHTDECLALVFIGMAGIEYDVVRTRNPELLSQQDLLLDVGGRDDARCLDHHGRDFKVFHKETGTKFATAGLVWDDLGDIIVRNQLPDGDWDEETILAINDKVLERIVIPVDASDNGESGELSPLRPLGLTEIVNTFNCKDQSKQYAAFIAAVAFVDTAVRSVISEYVGDAIEHQRIWTAMQHQADSEIFTLMDVGPWIGTALQHWDETAHFKVAVYPDPVKQGEWRIQSFPGSQENTFEQRCSAPANLKGLSAGQFPDDFPYKDNMVFVHAAGFIGGVKGSYDDAIKVARYWIDHSSSNNS